VTECPACAAPLTVAPSTAELTCPACRAPLAVRITPVPDGAFRGGSVRGLALIPVPPPDDSVVDRSTPGVLHLEVTRLGLSEGPGRLLVGFGLGSVLLTVGACLALVKGGLTAAIVVSLLGVGLLVVSVRGMLRSATISRLRRVRIEGETLSLLGPGDPRERHALADVVSFAVTTHDGAGHVYATKRDGTLFSVTEVIPEDAAFWVLRRLSQAIRKS
jgi:hypothetical protein